MTVDEFKLHRRLLEDCFVIAERQNSILLLLNNVYYPWFILVPVTSKLELYEIEPEFRSELFASIDKLSLYLKKTFNVDKLNVAAIGNLVPQLHIHVVGRCHNDPAWPGVVWGHPDKKSYSEDQVEEIKQQVQTIW